VHWTSAVSQLRAQRRWGVLITLLTVTGHAPREAGAKMVVAQEQCWGTIGGGNLEQTAVQRARRLIADGSRGPRTSTVRLTERAVAEHGVQCCGGEVGVLFEPLPPVPAVAILGMGHVGTELARVLARHDIELHLVDSRAGQVDLDRLTMITADALAGVHLHHALVPELVLGVLPPGCHVLIMTHDHAEDIALCDAALRCAHLASIGLIGSAAKWRRFAKRLAAEGHSGEDLARISTPIGMAQIAGKDPATVALSVAADLVRRFERERSHSPSLESIEPTGQRRR
jgi:xanthine dehydrogenase accessory factor